MQGSATRESEIAAVPTGRPVGLASWPKALHVGAEHAKTHYDMPIELQVHTMPESCATRLGNAGHVQRASL